MIVTVVSMPEGVVVRTGLAQARERLAVTSGFVIVDIDLEDEPSPVDEPLSRRLGLDAAAGEWLGGAEEHVRVEYHDGTAVGVVPVVCGNEVTHIHVLADERRFVTVHHGPVELIETFIDQLPQDLPPDAVTTMFLFLQGVLETFRRAVTQAHLEVEDLEEAMFERRQPEHVHRLARLRRRAARLHRAFLPYAAVAQEILVRRRMANHALPKERQEMNRLHEHTMQLVLVEIEALRDAARRAATSYASLVADQQNVVINRLTIVSMVFLPLSFLTGFFGMNFGYLTNRLTSEDSFLEFGLGLQVGAVAVALYYVLYRTHWRQLHDSRARDAADDQP
ncbi:CorA family divalent cation transporter [Streptomyces sp. NBC_01728]|uniref:magnesium transporter CorA family protein n=1 Tax=unclassified Streptomyces TaxID=2593676 RepID=UPI002257E119|nr:MULTISPECIES: CorA family divalent cation transporter [unclassified Streptomyces]MCX4457911.1 CorA family divalent cation transporter [Streptomyces sp. NBC_01719]MCX4497268.1 CorA family divalent cation transporter [Streptomyces sp. NBC_01728]